MKFPAENCGDHGARNNSRRRNPDYDLGVVCSRHFQGESAGQFAEERPFYFEHAFGGVDRAFAG